MQLPLRTRRFTVAEYYRMTEAGVLGASERVELIEGEIIEMAAIGSRHAACVSRLDRLLQRHMGERGHVRVQLPLRISDLSEPEPDVAIVRPRADDYASGHPGPADTLLVMEVGDTTVEYDREVKAPLYAIAGIVEYWLVNLAADDIEVYREPAAAGYGAVRRHARGEILHMTAFPEFVFPTSDILP